MYSQWLMALVTVLLGLLLTLWLRRSNVKKSIKWPAGPPKLPIIGNLHQLHNGGELLHVTLANMAKEYGSMMTVWFGGWSPSVVISDFELAWEVLVTKSSDYASRKLPYSSRFISADLRTIATSNYGPYWDTLRKGLQSNALSPLHITNQADLQQTDVEALIQGLELEASLKGRVVLPLVHIRRMTVRFIARLIFGVNSVEDKFVEDIDDAVDEAIKLGGSAPIVDAFPIARFIPGLSASSQQNRVKPMVEEPIRPFLSHPKPNTYLHFLISQGLPEHVVIYLIFEVFMLAVDSASNTVAWALAFLVQNQEIQEKLYQEIKSMGSGSTKGSVNIQEVSKMQYLHAVMKESMRMKPIAPLAVPHGTSKDCMLMGAKIPEGTMVMVNLYAVLNDPKVWEEPNKFMPERFLPPASHDSDAAARFIAMERSFLPFGAGRRICAGSEVAKLHVVLTLANLVNAYRWVPVDGHPPEMSEELSFVLMMKTPLSVCIEPRCD